MNLNDLPDEVLEQIFDELDVYELKLASLVCRRWAELTFSGQRMDRVCLVYPDAEWELLLNSRRSYRNIRQKFSNRLLNGQFESLAQLLRTLNLPVRMLDMHCFISFQELQWILLEVPGLQHFSIRGYINPQCETNEPFPVLTNLKCLKLRDLRSNQFDFFRMNVTNLQSLYMNCETDRELEEWRQLSNQLKLVHVYRLNSTYISQFLELTFPHLEDFTIEEVAYGTTEEIASSHDFFRRHSLLRRLSVGVPISVEWIRSITSHCPELTYLYLFLKNMEEGILESLVHLTKLQYLSLDGPEEANLDTKLFRGAIKSLESVELEMHPTRVFLENLFEAAPQLNSLEIKATDRSNLQLDIEFICEKFSCLRRLEFDMYEQKPADNSVRIDRLEHLEELKICFAKGISFIHRNNVRCLTLSVPMLRKRDLDEIPKKFPRLNRFTINCGYSVFASRFTRLHKLMPSCRIDYDSHRFYPQVLP